MGLRNQRSNVALSAAREPATARGAAKRSRLILAARNVFEKKGFLETRITDIAAAANSASGTFYIYFDSKEAVFEAVIDEAINELLSALRAGRPESSDPATLIAHDNEQYVIAYRQHSDILRAMEQVATFNTHFARVRQSVRDRFVDRATRSIITWSNEGKCNITTTPRTVAGLLVAMTDNFCYHWLALDRNYADEEVVAGMNMIWTRALDLTSK